MEISCVPPLHRLSGGPGGRRGRLAHALKALSLDPRLAIEHQILALTTSRPLSQQEKRPRAWCHPPEGVEAVGAVAEGDAVIPAADGIGRADQSLRSPTVQLRPCAAYPHSAEVTKPRLAAVEEDVVGSPTSF